jgi:hypothetical protein
MVVTMYSTAIHNAIKSGDKTTMTSVLKQAKSVLGEQGDLKAAIKQLERAIKKVKS